MSSIEVQGTVYSRIPGYVFIETTRTSGVKDIIPVKGLHAKIDDRIHLMGTLKTRSFKDGNDISHKEMYVENDVILENKDNDINTVCFDGYLCKKDILRKTPMGRTVIDFVVAINHSKTSSSYISCIIWSQAARWLDTLPIGTKVHCIGRFQSREYKKNDETRIAYEICVNEIYVNNCVNEVGK